MELSGDIEYDEELGEYSADDIDGLLKDTFKDINVGD